jgi:hypothetical protein
MSEQALQAQIDRLRTLLALSGGAAPSPTTTNVVPFSFTSASPLVLTPITIGQRVIRAAVAILTPFDGFGPTIALGTPTSPGLILDAGDIDAKQAGQYENDVIFPFSTATTLQLTIFSGASTQGDGLVLYALEG